jgi:hypothetical protein
MGGEGLGMLLEAEGAGGATGGGAVAVGWVVVGVVIGTTVVAGSNGDGAGRDPVIPGRREGGAGVFPPRRCDSVAGAPPKTTEVNLRSFSSWNAACWRDCGVVGLGLERRSSSKLLPLLSRTRRASSSAVWLKRHKTVAPKRTTAVTSSFARTASMKPRILLALAMFSFIVSTRSASRGSVLLGSIVAR